MAKKFSINKIAKNFQKLKKTLPVEVGNLAQNFFRSSFEKQGFTDSSFKAWKPKENKNAKAKILVGEKRGGTLRRSVGSSLKTTSWDNISFKVPLDYAAIHNNGGTINKKSRTFDLGFRKRRGMDVMIFAKIGGKKKKATFIQTVTAGAHTITMPQRKFMGNSKVMFKKIDNVIHKQMKRLNK